MILKSFKKNKIKNKRKKIYLKSPNGKEIPISINETNTIYELKQKYGDINILLSFDSVILKNEKTIS